MNKKQPVPAPKDYVQRMCALVGMAPETVESHLRELIAGGYVRVVVEADGSIAYLPGRAPDWDMGNG